MPRVSCLGLIGRVGSLPLLPVSLGAHVDQNANNAAIQLLVLATQRAELAENYAPFFRARGLDAAQTAQLNDLLTRRLEQHDDFEQVARRQPSTRFTTVKAEHARTETEFNATLRATLAPTRKLTSTTTNAPAPPAPSSPNSPASLPYPELPSRPSRPTSSRSSQRTRAHPSRRAA